MRTAAQQHTAAGASGVPQPCGIHTQGSIWARAIQQQEAASSSSGSTQQQGRGDGHVFFVGPEGSGKSTLISRFLYPHKAEAPKPSAGLEYTYARKAAAYDASRKEVAHIWELSGGAELASHLTRGSHVFLSPRQVATTVVVVVLDLSQPAPAVLQAAQHWLSAVRARLAGTGAAAAGEQQGVARRQQQQQLLQALQARQRAAVFKGHPDAHLVDCTGVSMVLACTKWDVLRDGADPQVLRTLAGALRWLAHANAAHLVFMGGLQQQPAAAGAAAAAASAAAGGGGRTAGGAAAVGGAAEAARQLDSFSRLLNHLAFVGMGRKIPLRQQPAFDHLGPLLVPAGADGFAAIGLPGGGSSSASSGSSSACSSAADVAAGQAAWLAAAHAAAPPAATAGDGKQQQQQQRAGAGGAGPTRAAAAAFGEAFGEAEVDAAYAARDAALATAAAQRA